jgi:glycosyltransferase involved in cell wall biosynthesis
VAFHREQDKARFQGNPRVSVIIPTYNRATFIGAAIQSVLNQTFADFELIVVDDGSTDGTKDVASRYASDNRFTYLQQDNGGRSSARNRALALARGAYIAFLDSDDTYLPEKLALQVSYLDSHPDVDMLYTSAACVDLNGRELKNHGYIASDEGYIYELIAFFQPLTITLPTVMLRRAVMDEMGGFDLNMERFEDTDLWRRIAKKHRIGAMRQVTCLLTTHDDNALMNQNSKKIIQAIEYYITKVFREDHDMGMKLLRRGASRLCEYYGRAFLVWPGQSRYGIRLIGKAIRYAPERSIGIVIRAVWTSLRRVLCAGAGK